MLPFPLSLMASLVLLQGPIQVNPTQIFIGPTISEHTIQVTLPDGTTADEDVMIQTPGLVQAGTGNPLVVALHGYSRTEASIFANDVMLSEEAAQRHWFVLAPLGRNQFDHGTRHGRAHVEGAIQWMIDNYAIDETRIYGMGLSMGGSGVLAWAANHQDPDGPRFAALATNAALPSQRAAYATADDAGDVCTLGVPNPIRQMVFRCIIGDQFQGFDCFGDASFACDNFAPDDPMDDWETVPFLYQAASALDLQEVGTEWEETPLVPAMAHNIRHVPIQVWYDVNDTVHSGEIPAMNDALVDWWEDVGRPATLPTPIVQKKDVDDPNDNDEFHEWDTMDYDDVFGFFAMHSVEFPAPSTLRDTYTHVTVASEPDTYQFFTVEQWDDVNPFDEIDWTTGFSTFSWSYFPAIGTDPHLQLKDNVINFGFGQNPAHDTHATTNVRTIRFDYQAAGLDARQDTNGASTGNGGIRLMMAGDSTNPEYLQTVILENYPGDPELTGEIDWFGCPDIDVEYQAPDLIVTRCCPEFTSIRILFDPDVAGPDVSCP
ncbi:MAG: hypothetical protein AAF533_20535 [Acidobacteriota bacterium]